MTGWGGRGGGTQFPGPSPLCASGEKGGRGLPLTPPECKQQQMNKNKNTKGRRSSWTSPHPRVFPVTSGGPSLPHPPKLPQSWGLPSASHIPGEQSPGLRTAGPAAHTGDGRQAPCWCAGSAGTSSRDRATQGGGREEGERGEESQGR